MRCLIGAALIRVNTVFVPNISPFLIDFKGAVSRLSSILDKSPWDSNAVFIISGFPHKTVHPFRNFLAVLPPLTLYKDETRGKFWIHSFNVVCGVRAGVGPV